LSRPYRLELIAGHPVLDLVNTVSWRGNPRRRIERIQDFDALLAWSESAGLLDRNEHERIRRATDRTPELQRRTLADVKRLRESLHQALTATGPEREQALQHLWPQLTAALRHLHPRDLPLTMTIEIHEPNDLPRKLALLALQLLASDEVRLVNACADPECGWVFLDRSHNRSRRWCSSSDCGNRNRVRRYHARHAQE
jgi:predicted RNA-binding Zn ribbon-like protein